MGNYQNIIVEKNEGIARVIMNSSQALNALNKQALDEITAVFNDNLGKAAEGWLKES